MKFYILKWRGFVCDERGAFITGEPYSKAWVEFTPTAMEEFTGGRSTNWEIVELNTDG